ncbi:methyltransferase [Streptomyces sp. NBC_01218]|uniref:HemK2/MTQ2 family protein methyltransferase n=1 Tax=unclassified Streptomyces TaxID=2593676 RepID=UPI0023B8F9F8|nr:MULTISPECIES: HemK2/MTQ2 family protein methyltransferase [unclassified Streptomyces]WEH38180.1 methyltransferase [Streptomyces sp. AM 2-1-1]WSQ49840.1 methyltransferase [Streptomyces sp. NBC_01218]
MATDVASPAPFVLTLPGVYAPQHDTRLLMRALEREILAPGAQVLDLGTGSGALAIRAAQLGGSVTALDLARRAVLTARINALLHRHRIDVRRSDLTAAVRGRAYDLLLCNPPYVPSPAPGLPGRGRARAWDAGLDGRIVLDRVCDGAREVLRPGGALLMVHSALCDPELTLARLEAAGLPAVVCERARVPLGPVLRSRRAWLRDRGLLGQGAVTEELVVVRAVRER